MDTTALKDSWALVTKSGDDVPLFFYSHLFLSHPELRAMFPISMSGQRDKFVAALGQVVSQVDELDRITPYLEQLGRDHRRFSVVAEHYSPVGGSLLATLRHFLGAAWTEELAADWAAAYGAVAKVMVGAAEESEATSPAWWDAEVVDIERRTIDVTVLTVRPSQHLDFAPGQSMAMEIPQRPRMWRYFSPANAPREDGSLEFHVQPVDGGKVSSAVVRSLQSGETVRLGAPIGEALTLGSENSDDLLLVAGGTGLAPLRAVVEQLDRRWHADEHVPDVELFHGARMAWNLYDNQRLKQLAADRPWFSYTGVVSDDPSYPGAKGLVATPAKARARDRTALVCGSGPMVTHSVTELTDAGVAPARIRYEKYTSDPSTSESTQIR